MADTATRSAHRDGVSGAPAVARAGCAAAVAVLAAAIALSACGSAPRASPEYEVQARVVPGLGKIITDGNGFTLYMYAPDHQGPSRCARFCAQQWPPLVLPHGVDRPKAGPGIKPALLGTAPRAGGQLQETYNGWPLYLWIGDSAPGQATGQADDMGLWYALSVTGSVDRSTPRG